MAGKTSVFELPYPEDNELPNGPAQIKALAEAMEAALLAAVPTGSIIMLGAEEAAPAGFVIPEGQAVERTGKYAKLFAKYGTKWGAGNGTTTFNLPNMTERVPVGKGATLKVGSSGGEATVTLNGTQIPAHTHPYTDPGHAHPIDVQNFSSWSQSGPQETTVHVPSGLNTHPAFTGITIQNNVGGGGAHNNMQPYVVVQYAVRYL